MSSAESSRRYGWIDAEIRSTAVLMTQALLPSAGSVWAACREVAGQLQVHPNTVRNWYQSCLEDPTTPPVDEAELARMRERLRALEQVNAELVAALREHTEARRR